MDGRSGVWLVPWDAAMMLTCPHCRALVDYSCLCDEPAPDNDYIEHESVDAAKLWVRRATLADATPNPIPKEG